MHNARTALHVDTKSDLINRTVGRNEEYRKPSLRQILNLVSLFLYEDRIKRRHRTKNVSGIILKNEDDEIITTCFSPHPETYGWEVTKLHNNLHCIEINFSKILYSS